MTEHYTIQDFEAAAFAVASDPSIANAVRNSSEKVWRLSNGLAKMTDAEIQCQGKWIPVQEQAEKEREGARKKVAEYVSLLAAPPARPLTADDFDQMKAAWEAADNDMAPRDGDTLIVWKGRDWWEVGVALPGRPLDNRLARVLHRPPSRPEGAEEVEKILGSWPLSDALGRHFTADALGSLADHIAKEMNR